MAARLRLGSFRRSRGAVPEAMQASDYGAGTAPKMFAFGGVGDGLKKYESF